MSLTSRIYAALPFDGPALCSACLEDRVGFAPHFVLDRMQREGLVRTSPPPCSECGAESAPPLLLGHPRAFLTAVREPRPRQRGAGFEHVCYRVLDTLRQTSGYLCLRCLERPLFSFQEATGPLAALEGSGHAGRSDGRCSRCGTRAEVWRAVEEDRVRRQVSTKILRLIPAAVVSAGIAALMIVGVLVLDQRLWPHSSFVIGAIGFLLLTWGIMVAEFTVRGPVRYTFAATGVTASILWGPSLYLAAFFFLARGLWLQFGDGVFQLPGPPDDVTWLLYLLDNFIRAILFDAAEIYGWDVSGVRHADNLPAATLVFVFRFTLGLGLLKTLTRGLQILRSPYWRLPRTAE